MPTSSARGSMMAHPTIFLSASIRRPSARLDSQPTFSKWWGIACAASLLGCRNHSFSRARHLIEHFRVPGLLGATKLVPLAALG